MSTDAARTWRPPPRIAGATTRRLLWSGAVVYAVVALFTIDVDAARMAEGAARAVDFFGGGLRPDFVTRWTDIRTG
ncbi:MAG: phosphonate ABC transporter, permease protein PhnE, partial [Acidimicrobiia bacterium]|nr:phosphonate ABC transporter, permease protein PhnE [Acidimicrobiia bacterium]